MRLVEDNVSSLSLLDIYKLRCAKRQLEPDTPVTRYYEKLAAVQVSPSLSQSAGELDACWHFGDIAELNGWCYISRLCLICGIFIIELQRLIYCMEGGD